MAVKAFSVEDGNLSNRALVTSRARLYSDIDLTFQPKTTGDVYKKADVAAVKQAVKNLLLTNNGEKPYQPLFGANLSGLLFELADELTEDDLKVAITNAIETYEPRAELISIDVNVAPDSNTVGVIVTFRIRNTEEVVQVQTSIVRAR